MPRSSLRENGAIGLIFIICRALQFACLIASMGISANLISEMIDNMQQPPSPVIGVLCITCFGALYVIITCALYYDNQLPKHYAAFSDTMFFTALLALSVVVGKPLSYLSCKAVGAATGTTYEYVKRGNVYMLPVHYAQWVLGSQKSCDMMKAVWGLSIVMTILFAFSTACLVFLWKREGRVVGKRFGVNV